MKTDLILMAAGNSRRFGSNKLLYEWKGKKLYRHMLDALMEAAEELEKNSGADTGNRASVFKDGKALSVRFSVDVSSLVSPIPTKGVRQMPKNRTLYANFHFFIVSAS